MKLHVSASNCHHQVSTPIKKILYICVGGVDVEICMLHPLFEYTTPSHLVTHTTGMTHIKIRYPVHKSPPSVSARSHMYTVRALPYDVINIHRSSCKVLLLLVDFNATLNFLDRFSNKIY